MSFFKRANWIPALGAGQAQTAVSEFSQMLTGEALIRQNSRQDQIEYSSVMVKPASKNSEDWDIADKGYHNHL
jgi:hypothetical protein